MMDGAFKSGYYRNVFTELGYKEEDVSKKLSDSFQIMFYGLPEERIYYSVGEDFGYIVDTGNHDVRTEGMSYGMMMCVQLDKKEEFDRLWNWAKTYMYMDTGVNKGYFAWSCKTDGTKNSYGPAPDGEEYFALALFFASNRWGDGDGIFYYSKEARELLHECIHKGELDGMGDPMWEPSNYLIKFIPNCNFTDPSYHLPHFYELFALWAYEEDRDFFKKAADASRKYLRLACHEKTGLCAEYAEYDGTAHSGDQEVFGRHDWYYSDAYRTIANIGLDYFWFAADDWQVTCANNLQQFFCETVKHHASGIYEIDGTIIKGEALHPVAIIATNAQASLAADGPYAKECVEKFYHTALRDGDRRYYDNCLYMFALLALSGNYRIWK